MSEKLRFDEHLKNTHIPETVEEIIATGNALLLDASEHGNQYHTSHYQTPEISGDIWKRSAPDTASLYIQLGVHAFSRGGMIAAYNNHRPIDHHFPEPPVDLNTLIHTEGYKQASLSVFELDGRTLPILYQTVGYRNRTLYPSSLNAADNDEYAAVFEEALVEFHEAFHETVALLGLARISHLVQENRSRSAISANAL